MDIKITWDLIVYTRRLPLGCLVNNYRTCFLTEPPRATREIPMQRKHIVEQTTKKSRRGATSTIKDQRAPLVLDIHGFIRAFRGKDENARAEIDTYMDYCAQRWQRREGTYQLKRRRLLPDVRDPREIKKWT